MMAIRRSAMFPLILAAAVALCLHGCGRRATVYRGDFIDPVDIDLRDTVDEKISNLSDSLCLASGKDKVALHRKLAVAYRIVGTPESRLRSIEEIDAALRLAPDDPLLYVEKGLTRCAQRFTGDAVSCLKRAIEIDPGCFEAWYHLGRIHMDDYLENMCFIGKLRKAAACFRRAIAIDGTDEDALFDLGLLCLLDGLSAETSRCFSTGERLHPDSPRFPLLAAVSLLESDRFEDAAARFEKALSLMDEDERREYEDIRALLSDSDAAYYGNLDDNNRNDYNRRFWARNDPTPATPVNERLLEHYRRVFLSRELLSLPRMGREGPETVRGRTLIRYGVPTKIDYSLGVSTDGPFVIWNYITGDQQFRLYFEDEYLNGDYHIPINPKFQTLADITEGILQMVPQIYRYPVPFGDLPAALQWAQTRGPGESTRFEFSLALGSCPALESDGLCRLDLTFFDSDWNRFRTESFEARTDSLATIERSDARWYVLPFARDILPRELECITAIEITGGSPPVRAVRMQPLMMRGFHGRSLVMSSVRITLPGGAGLCSDVLDPIPLFRSGEPICVSYEAFNLKLDEERRARYRVSYSIIKAGPLEEHDGLRKTLSYIAASIRGSRRDEEAFITNSFERGTDLSSIEDSLQIDTASLGEGRYLLVLEIEDLVAGGTVSDQREFTVKEAAR